ncbi:glycogen debranching protein GlgX [Rubellimicrobium sp. CFH 75288]|uniref:glycogen debranching protein GlgX n=1 Tax=Rubellimicrobium sp. CFH 75288 TaxID=2697034 RepID=UPI001411B41B|nr:glycogen debranching protein GlgX [Rubellimicrobium sp. CFH 75288]NAZ36059.1 glycogen debranching protein GlgX [Rubellimicrobium sp. CFH 75288]
MIRHGPIEEGLPYPLGATWDGGGVNFAVFSQHASAITLCLFSPDGRHEVERITLPERCGHVWHGYVPGLGPGTLYGLRAHGPYRPDEGHRFNHHKLLLDPYARLLTGAPEWDDALFGYDTRARHADLTFDTRDSVRFMPRCVVVDPSFDWDGDRAPRTPLTDTVIYEAHVRGLTMERRDVPLRGTFEGLASEPVLDHLLRLGVTAIELLPVQAFLDDRFLVERGLRNYWGYMTLGFFAPEPRYLGAAGIDGFKRMVRRFHEAGIEVILDVVYNHTCEGNQMGPTLSFRGLDNASYYRLAETPRYYLNDTGTGNTLNTDHPMVLRMVMDSLRYWAEVMHVDGFRFDLAPALARTPRGFDRNHPLIQAMRQDPVLAKVKLIAEPWDVGPGGYQLGAFPAPFLEWNDKFRDQVRRFWRGDPDMVRKLAMRLSGSALKFDHDGRPATSSVNFVTAHDGFTLSDLVSYREKHNEANGEDNRDGHGDNNSDNLGVEGPTQDRAILAARAQRRRNLMATLMLSQGTPMILAGDEIGNSQGGNNNAYCQDNPIGWVNWDSADTEFLEFCRSIIAFRKRHPILRQKRFLHSRSRSIDGKEDIFWRRADGAPMTEADWNNIAQRHIAVELRTAEGTPPYAAREEALFAVFNVGDALDVTLPDPPEGQGWVRHVDTARPHARPVPVRRGTIPVAANSIVVLALEAVGEQRRQ